MNMNEYLVKLKNSFLDPSNLNANDMLSNLDVQEDFVDDAVCMTKIQSDVCCDIENSDPCVLGHDVFSDIEMFRCFTEKNSTTIFDKINHCSLKGSQQLLQKLLAAPVHNVNTLVLRQDILRQLESLLQANKDLELTHENEKHIFWLYQDIDQNLKDLYNMVFFRFCLFKPLNKYPEAITINNVYKIMFSPFIGILSPILYVIVPFLIITFKMKINIPFKIYVKIMLSTLMSGELFSGASGGNYSYFRVISCVFSIIFYFQGILNSFELSKTLYKISKHLVEKVNNIVSFLKRAHEFVKIYWTDDMTKVFYKTSCLKSSDSETKYIDTLDVLPFTLRSNFGKQLQTYITFDKDIIKSVVMKTYIIDSLLSITKFKNSVQASYTRFLDQPKPVVQLEDSFHPCLPLDKVVKNSISLGSEHKNAILTGPNAGGKSTFVKSLIINVVLSQTIGLCTAATGIMTPMYVINSQINIPDCKGYESLFEAEMYRCKDKLDLLREHGDKRCFFIMDEIFNSTNPVEGIAGAYAIAKKISEHDNCILMFTTHYTYLTKLQKTTGRFINLKMNISRSENNDIIYPYKLVKGVSKQYIALDLLSKNGFDVDIIEEALSIKNKLTT